MRNLAFLIILTFLWSCNKHYDNGTYCSSVFFYSDEKESTVDYTLNTLVENDSVKAIHFPKGGTLSVKHFTSGGKLNNKGYTTIFTDKGYIYAVSLTHLYPCKNDDYMNTPQCSGITKDGKRCSNSGLPDYCLNHIIDHDQTIEGNQVDVELEPEID
jgi:hypothetical protein